MAALSRASRFLIDAMAVIAGAVLVWLMVSLVVSVAMRNAGLQPFAWLFTSTEYGLLYMTMLGAPWLVRARGHVHIELVTAALPDRARRTRTVTVRMAVEDPDNQLRHGSLASVALMTSLDQGGFWLPQSALTDNLRGLWAAYIVKETAGGPATVERVDLEILHTEADRVYARGGLRSGDRVVADGVQRLSPGTRVSVVKERNADR